MDLSTYALMYLELNVVSVLLVCVIRHKSNGLSQMVAQRNFVMAIDANKFKSINDTYGHAAGDMALVRIAEALNRSCRFTNKRSHIARYGGDEFAVFICGADPELMDSLKEKISESLKELNDADKAPYELSVSMGYTKVTYWQPLKNAIEMAYKNLYEDKERFHANEQKSSLDS